MSAVENALLQLESKRNPSEKHSFLSQLFKDHSRTFRKVVNKLDDHLIYVSEPLHVRSIDLSRMEKLEQRVIDSTISDDLLPPQIAVINNHQHFADKFVVKLHSHLKTARINIGNALPITVDLKNIDELDKVIKSLIVLYPKLHILYIDRNDSIVTFLSSDRNISDDVLEFFEKYYPDTNATTLKKLIWSMKDDLYLPYGNGHRRGSSLKEVIEHIKTIPGKPFSLPAVSVSVDNSGYNHEQIELDGRWIKKRKPENELKPPTIMITITKININDQDRENVLEKLRANAIIDDVDKIEDLQKDGSLPSCLNIIIKEHLKIDLNKKFQESIESLTGEKIGPDSLIWETAFVMVYLDTIFGRKQCQDVYDKAKKWIDGNLGYQFDQLKDTCMDYLIEIGVIFYNKPVAIHTFEINDDEMETVYEYIKVQNDINSLLNSILEKGSSDGVITSGNFTINFDDKDDKTIEALKLYIDVVGARRFDKGVLVTFFAIVFLDTFLKDDTSKSKLKSARDRIHDNKVQNSKLVESITRACEQYLKKRAYDFYTEMIDL